MWQTHNNPENPRLQRIIMDLPVAPPPPESMSRQKSLSHNVLYKSRCWHPGHKAVGKQDKDKKKMLYSVFCRAEDTSQIPCTLIIKINQASRIKKQELTSKNQEARIKNQESRNKNPPNSRVYYYQKSRIKNNYSYPYPPSSSE
jgi:hypothetical protein